MPSNFTFVTLNPPDFQEFKINEQPSPRHSNSFIHNKFNAFPPFIEEKGTLLTKFLTVSWYLTFIDNSPLR
jgi:hypothetical protein